MREGNVTYGRHGTSTELSNILKYLVKHTSLWKERREEGYPRVGEHRQG